LLGEGEDLFGVEHLVVGLEKSLDGGFVDLHLQAADADGSVANLSVSLGCLVGRFDSLDSCWRNGIQVDGQAQTANPTACFGRYQFGARGPRADSGLCPLKDFVRLRSVSDREPLKLGFGNLFSDAATNRFGTL